MDYCDEAGIVNEPTDGAQSTASAFPINKFHFEGVSFYTDEFPAEARTFSRSLIENRVRILYFILFFKTIFN